MVVSDLSMSGLLDRLEDVFVSVADEVRTDADLAAVLSPNMSSLR